MVSGGFGELAGLILGMMDADGKVVRRILTVTSVVAVTVSVTVTVVAVTVAGGPVTCCDISLTARENFLKIPHTVVNFVTVATPTVVFVTVLGTTRQLHAELTTAGEYLSIGGGL